MKKAKRSLAKLKIAFSGTSGSGKTLSALLVAFGMLKAAHPESADAEIWEKICVIDTENASASLYVNSRHGQTQVGTYNTIELDPPFTPERYIEAIQLAESSGIECTIIDSLSHAWTGAGGMLEMQSNAMVKSGNSYTAWRDVTPKHNRLVDTILQSTMHIFVTMRSKTEYVLEENEKGKKVPRKIGMAPVFRDGIEYEFAVVFEINQQHMAYANKDRTSIFDGETMLLSPKEGKRLYEWLQSGSPEAATMKPVRQPQTVTAVTNDASAEPEKPEDGFQKDFISYVEDTVSGQTREFKLKVTAIIKENNDGSSNFKAITDEDVMNRIIAGIEEAKEKGELNV